MKNATCFFIFSYLLIIAACSKNETIKPKEDVVAVKTSLSFLQDTLPLVFSVATARKENIGSIFTTTIEGKYPDSTVRKNSLIIRVTGDSARPYRNTEIFVSYIDSSGIAYSNTISDTINKVSITKIEKKKNGLLEGSFTIRVSNSTKTKTYLLANGIFFTVFPEY